MRTLKVLREGKNIRLWVDNGFANIPQPTGKEFNDIDIVEVDLRSGKNFDSVHSEVEPEPSGEPKGEDASIAQWRQIAQEQKVLIDQLLDTIAKISNAPMVVPVDRRY